MSQTATITPTVPVHELWEATAPVTRDYGCDCVELAREALSHVGCARKLSDSTSTSDLSTFQARIGAFANRYCDTSHSRAYLAAAGLNQSRSDTCSSRYELLSQKACLVM